MKTLYLVVLSLVLVGCSVRFFSDGNGAKKTYTIGQQKECSDVVNDK